MGRRFPFAAFAFAVACVLGLPGIAHADEAIPVPGKRMGEDHTYGRLEGDVTLVGGVGASFGPTAPRATAEVRARYLDTAGIFVAYEDGTLFKSASEPRRLLAFGLELRPLFLARLAKGWELGSPWADLTLDSFGLEIGATFAQPVGGSFGSRAGLQTGVGLEVPVLGRATGPWVGFHGGLRLGDSALSSGDVKTPIDRSLYLSITLSWHHVVLTHVVDVGDRAPRRD